jgi:hypothetical protein
MRRIVLLAVVLALAILAGPVQAAHSPTVTAKTFWGCVPGPSIEAHAVVGGIEVTAVPEGTWRIRSKFSRDAAGHGQRERSTYADPDETPLLIPAPSGTYVDSLAKGRWERGNPYPSLGCPTGRLRVP